MKTSQRPFFGVFLHYAIVLSFLFTGQLNAQELVRASTLPDVSGLAWIEDDLFLSVHDAKRSPEKRNWPRVSIVHLPKSELQGVSWQSLDLRFPGIEGRSSDLESVSRIPGSNEFLFAESGQEGTDDRRIFHAIYNKGSLNIDSFIDWPVDIENVEATAVYRAGEHLIFLYAERADGRPSTKLRWATLSLNPLKIGKFEEVTFVGIGPTGAGTRPIVAMDIDSDGFIYIASAYDSGNDAGPFRSVVWRIGRMTTGDDGNPKPELGENLRLASLDGLKVESVVVLESGEDGKKVYVGTDDEHYGGIIRLLPGLHLN